ncbi:MAG: RDD family protein [Candidatus Hydrogenedentales bacterium]
MSTTTLSTPRTAERLIRTPEGVVFALPLAGPVLRFLAWAVDLAAVIALTIVVSTVAGYFGLVAPDLAGAVMMLSAFVINITYGIALEWVWRGQTLGKRVLRLRVVDQAGLHLTFSQIVLRNLLRAVDALPALYLLGGTICFMSRYHQRLGDLAANTVVMRVPRLAEPKVTAILAGKYNSFREYPHVQARLRAQVSPVEAALALQALLRRDELDAAERVTLFQDFAGHFRAAATFPEEATRGLTDEQYIRNTVDSVYNVRSIEM